MSVVDKLIHLMDKSLADCNGIIDDTSSANVNEFVDDMYNNTCLDYIADCEWEKLANYIVTLLPQKKDNSVITRIVSRTSYISFIKPFILLLMKNEMFSLVLKWYSDRLSYWLLLREDMTKEEITNIDLFSCSKRNLSAMLLCVKMLLKKSIIDRNDLRDVIREKVNSRNGKINKVELILWKLTKYQ